MKDKNQFDISLLSCAEKVEFLRENPIFWSRFGFEKESGNIKNHLLNAERHKSFYERGITAHSSILPSGWIAPHTYDYTELDMLLEMLFSRVPDAVFLPRVKLNVPSGWCEENPDDVFVYSGGPRTREGILSIIGTEYHGYHPEKRTDLIALQSLSSKKWIADASEALFRFVRHIEDSRWAKNIIGYHIAYGTSGETTHWGSWERYPLHRGDYGINATKRFIEYARERGTELYDIPSVQERFFISDTPARDNFFHIGRPSLDELFYHKKEDRACRLYSEFMRDSNADAIEAFCKVVKDTAPDKIAGVFYGYIAEPPNCANSQHTAYDRILSSPFVDFLAAPKGYHRVSATDPGLGQCVGNSINRKKLYIDEIDHRTHLLRPNGRANIHIPCKDLAQTRAVYWREFSKNITYGQGYWWMDLGGGWLDDEEIKREIELLSDTSNELYLERDKGGSEAEILLIINENTVHNIRPNYSLHENSILFLASTIKECGVPTDFYRESDLDTLDLSRYKMIVLLNSFCTDHAHLKKALSRASSDCTIVWSYAAGIMDTKREKFGKDCIYSLTGFSVGEYKDTLPKEHSNSCFPLIYIENSGSISPLSLYSDKRIKAAARTDEYGRRHILLTMPGEVSVEDMREILLGSGVHLYAPEYCVVNADKRFIYVLAEKKMRLDIALKSPRRCQNVFTGEIYESSSVISTELEDGNCIFLKYIGV